ncbi:hypothetical protein EDF51_102166 [Curtobacterium sp. PhB25]|uniref:hypothetical protein n=1 Tax=unclassified Curtobacterium TaxID=257496 RepID=UPI00104B109B|nr:MULTISPECIES: hypothetical protein [unclassified Curtobacterium]TCU50954.1 hypothetical protein EDF33_1011461 [Curtobacterium sp. PhB146]TCU86626.1 hypothetical protein EDF48_102291 [Curtobacterium sp. PhB191]TDW51084.1 hypothetical protein EDF52_102175 [Curtobacterium sp. PhB42]TDW56070.1 hypothetical protein EDF47_104178 [Curtobacterium sp. PhB190]TDW73340.1 hypothetical protein EDF51_102166 [Curtobacterium sp. PhB25]
MTNDDETTQTFPPAAPVPAPAPEPARARRGARFGTIFWGVVLLVFAIAMAVSAIPVFSVDPTTLLLAACLAAGALLVVAGLVAVFTRPAR